jgi:heme/copper-type cytochrome/quinol oxidase subunit 2
VIILDIVALIDVIGDEKRDTMNKVIWAIVIVFMPVVGVLLYFFFGR